MKPSGGFRLPLPSGRRTRWGAAFVFAVSLVAGSALVASGATLNQSRGAADSLKIGITDALSGPGAAYDLPQLIAWKIVADEYNSRGGVLIGGKKYQIQIDACDDKLDPATARECVNKQVLQDHVQVVVTGGDPQDPVLPPVTEAHNVILQDRTANVTLVSPPHKYVWNSWTAAFVASKAYYQTILKLHPNIKTIYGVGTDFQYDHNNAKWDKASATSLGLKWIGQTFFPDSTIDFTSILAKVVRAHPDMIALGSEGAHTPSILKTLHQLGYHGVVGSDVAAEDLQRDIKGAGSAANGFYQVEAFTWPHTTQLKKFISKYTALSKPWNALAADQWIANELLIKAFQTAGNTNPDDVMAALEKVSTPDWLLPHAPRIKLGGKKTFGAVRELAFPLALNQAVKGAPVTRRVFQVTIP